MPKVPDPSAVSVTLPALAWQAVLVLLEDSLRDPRNTPKRAEQTAAIHKSIRRQVDRQTAQPTPPVPAKPAAPQPPAPSVRVGMLIHPCINGRAYNYLAAGYPAYRERQVWEVRYIYPHGALYCVGADGRSTLDHVTSWVRVR